MLCFYVWTTYFLRNNPKKYIERSFVTAQSKPTINNRISGLDELRGLSILWVMWCHGTSLWKWMPSSFSGYGFHGVVLFFVISGFLITKILINRFDEPNYLGEFYINRLFRIWPLMLLALLVSAICWPENAKMVIFNLLMVNNYAYAFGIEPLVRTDVMWSLAVEEQFYLIWPLVVFFCGRLSLPFVAAGIIILGLCFDSALIPAGRGIIFKTTHGNMQYIAMGCLIATGSQSFKLFLGSWAAFFGTYLITKGFDSGLSSFRWIWYGISFLIGLLVYVTVYWRPLIASRPLAEIGKLCYGLYIIHFFISWLMLEHFGSGNLWQGIIYFAISLILAVASFHILEFPILQSRSKIIGSPKARLFLFTCIVISALICIISMIPVLKH